MISRLVAPFTALLLALGLWVAPAEAASSNLCPDAGGTSYLVDTAADASDIAGGYNNPLCDLVITVNVVPTATDWDVRAKSYTVAGAEITNTAVNSAIHVQVPLAISLVNATMKARTDLSFRSTSVLGSCDFVGSTLIASSTLVKDGPGGKLTVQCFGPISDATTNLYAGSRIQFIGGSTVSVSCLVADQPSLLCEDPGLFCPGGFPCSRTINSLAEVTALFCGGAPPPPPVFCSGGANEVHISSKSTLTLQGILGPFFSHATFDSDENIEANNTTINVITNLAFNAQGTINGVGADWSAGQTVRAQTGPLCTAPSLCIDTHFANVLAGLNILFDTNASAGGIDLCAGSFIRAAVGLPRMNGDVTLPYGNNVKEDAIECAPLAPATIQ